MPIYEYKCKECGGEEEVFHRSQKTEPPMCQNETCTSRGLPKARKVSVGSFELRGGGWAKDGYGG